MAQQVKQSFLSTSRTSVETDKPVVFKTFKEGKPIAYTATEAAYVDGVLYKPGELFVTGKPKGSNWKPVDLKERASIEASKEVPGDVDLDALDVSALKALAATKGVNIGEAKSKADLITVIKAANEPTL